MLNNKNGVVISEETRARVLHAADELGYIPNEQARALSMTRRRAIGVFVCHPRSPLSDSFIMPLVDGMSHVMNRRRFGLVVQQVRMRDYDYRSLIEEDGVDGVVLINPHDDDAALDRLVETRFPTVVVGTVPAIPVPQVDIDNHDAARDAVRHLAELGHRRIAFISHSPFTYRAAHDRHRGYAAALAEANIRTEEQLQREAAFTEESGYTEAVRLLRLDDPPTAILAGNDVVAYGVMQAARDRGLSIPQDLSIVGIDDDYLSRFTRPPLTTVAVPAASMGAEAARLAVTSVVEGTHGEPRPIVLSHHLTVRGSSAAPG